MASQDRPTSLLWNCSRGRYPDKRPIIFRCCLWIPWAVIDRPYGLSRFCASLPPFLAGYESDDALRSLITLLADTRPDCRVIAIGDHCDLGTLVAGRLHRRGELNVLFP